jgi:hypothetical protein
MDKTTEDLPASFDETRAELLASLERAHELICEARQVIGPEAEAKPPSPVS